jgi:hypothetical protein
MQGQEKSIFWRNHQLLLQKEAIALFYFLISTWNYQVLKTLGVFMSQPEAIKKSNIVNPDDKVDQEGHNVEASLDKPEKPDANATVNPGDKIDPQAQTVEEKAKQVAVDVPDITGDHVKVPTYFVVEEPDGEEKALHHVKDAEEISDVIRQARTDEEGNRTWR